MTILPNLNSKFDGMSKADLIAALTAMSDRTSRVSFKVTEAREATGDKKASMGGAVSVYGLGRFPVTLYASQWRRLIEEVPALSAFLSANAGKLTEKQ